MPVFAYTARNATGEALQGRMEAISEDAVASQLSSSGITPLDINELQQASDIGKKIN